MDQIRLEFNVVRTVKRHIRLDIVDDLSEALPVELIDTFVQGPLFIAVATTVSSDFSPNLHHLLSRTASSGLLWHHQSFFRRTSRHS